MWCAVAATVHLSAAVVFFQSASLSFSRRVVASSTLTSNCVANVSPLAPMVSSLVCSSLYRRTMRLGIDMLGDTPCSPRAKAGGELLVRSRHALAVPAPHRSPLIFSARMPVKCFQPSSWPRPHSSSGSPVCVNTRSVVPRDGVISTVTRDSRPRVASDIQANSMGRDANLLPRAPGRPVDRGRGRRDQALCGHRAVGRRVVSATRYGPEVTGGAFDPPFAVEDGVSLNA